MTHHNIGNNLSSIKIFWKTTLTQKPIILKPSDYTISRVDLACDCSWYSSSGLSSMTLPRPLTAFSSATLQYFPIKKMIHYCFFTRDPFLALIAHSNNSYLDICKLSCQNSNAEGRFFVIRQHFGASETLPDFVIVDLHHSTFLDPKALSQHIFLINSKPNWAIVFI